LAKHGGSAGKVGLPGNYERAPGIVLEHHAIAVSALVEDKLPQGAFVEHIVGDDAILKVFTDDAISRTPRSPAVVVAPHLEIVAHTGGALGSLDQDMR
jgi:hypothetical protein